MKRRTPARRLAAWACVLACAAPFAVVGLPLSSDLAGEYMLEGVNRDATTYSGELEIVDLAPGHYELIWKDPEGVYKGQGTIVGHQLYTVFGLSEARCYVMLFSRAPNGELIGDWFSVTDAGSRGMETASPASEPGKEVRGTYVARGISPAGAAYERPLQILRMRGDYYHLRWDGAEPLVGIGELHDDGTLEVLLSTPGNAGQCGKSVMNITDDGSLVGTWMLNDEQFDVSGRETAVPR